jgi:hypothetical protein
VLLVFGKRARSTNGHRLTWTRLGLSVDQLFRSKESLALATSLARRVMYRGLLKR